MIRPLVLLAVLITTPAVSAESAERGGDMAAAADGFYRAYETFRPPDGIPDERTRRRFEPFISDSLNRLLVDVEEAEQRYENRTAGRFPPLIEGDPFTPNFDGATSFAIGDCSADGRSGRCAVSLSFEGGSEKPRSWTDSVVLVRTDAGWRVNDIVFGGAADAGGPSTLSGTLKSAIEHGNDMK